MTTAASNTTVAATPIIDPTDPVVNPASRPRRSCSVKMLVGPLPTPPATSRSNDTRSSRHEVKNSRLSRECARVEVVDLTKSVPTTPTSIVDSPVDLYAEGWRLGTPNSEASTVRLSETPSLEADIMLPSCLDDIQWEVAEILDITEDLVQVGWTPLRLTTTDLCNNLAGIPLLNYVNHFEKLDNGLCDVHWVATWEPYEEMFTTLTAMARQASRRLYHWVPAQILNEDRVEGCVRYLVQPRPSFHPLEDHQQLKRLAFGFRTIPYKAKNIFGAVWEPIWMDQDNVLPQFRTWQWVEAWTSVHREWSLRSRDT